MPYVTVQEGDCLSSISASYGLNWETVWNRSENAELRDRRKDPKILFPGDIVFVPELDPRTDQRATDAKHKFRRKGVPEYLSLKFLTEGEPRANEPFVLTVDGKVTIGHLDANGACEVPIDPKSASGTVVLGDPANGETYELRLGHMDPVEEISGVAARLHNLGYLDTVDADGDSQEFRDAVSAFQLEHKLDASQGLDDATRARLVDEHGS